MKMISCFSRLFMGLVLASVSVASNATELFGVGDTNLKFQAEDDFCAFNGAYAYDKAWLDWQTKANEGNNQLVGAYALCNELGQLRQGLPLAMSEWIILLAPAQGAPAKAQPMPDTTRQIFVDEITKELGKGIELDIENVANKTRQALAETTNTNVEPISVAGDNRPYLLGTTNSGVFAALTLQIKSNDYNQKVAAVIGMTMVQDYAVSVNAYRNFDEPDSINRLLVRAKTMIDYIVAAND